MMRSYVALTWAVSLVWIVACVNVDKPGKVITREQPDSGCTVGGWDAAKATQDADENGDLDQDRVADAPAFQGSEVGRSDGARDRGLDVPLAAFQDAAQDAARDVTGEQPVGLCWGAGGPVKAATWLKVVRVDGVRGFVSAWAEPLGGGERVWYFSAETFSPLVDGISAAPAAATRAVRIGPEHALGTFVVYIRVTLRPIGRDDLLRLSATAALVTAQVSLSVTSP